MTQGDIPAERLLEVHSLPLITDDAATSAAATCVVDPFLIVSDTVCTLDENGDDDDNDAGAKESGHLMNGQMTTTNDGDNATASPMPEHDELTPQVAVTPNTPAMDTPTPPSNEIPSSNSSAIPDAATEPMPPPLPVPGTVVAPMPVVDTSTTNNDASLLLELLEEQRTKSAEADHRARLAEERIHDYDAVVAEKHQLEQELNSRKVELASLAQDKNSLEVELTKLRDVRDEWERKEMLLSNRVNDAKKKEALKANLAEQLEDQVRSLQSQLSVMTTQWTDAVADQAASDAAHTAALASCKEQRDQAERALADERRLNDERKKKMKVFVESKSDELRQAKAQADDCQLELSQTNRSMREHQTRWKQLHAQWVQSQTRNRELQRELNKLQKDQETAHRMGDKMEQQMAKSAQETTLHKTKRLTAKNELLTLLGTLDAERELSGKLRDSIKFTFTPKALSQQQLMKESLKDLERELEQLSRKLGRPLPPSPETAYSLEDEEDGGSGGGAPDGEETPGKKSRSEIDTEHLLSNLEEETQRVSQCIMTLGTSIERLHMVLSGSGERNCVGVLHDILSAASGSQTYGQVRTNE